MESTAKYGKLYVIKNMQEAGSSQTVPGGSVCRFPLG